MLDPLTITTSVVGLVQFSEIVITRCFTYVKAVKNCEEEVSRLLSETSTLQNLLIRLQREIEKHQEEDDRINPSIAQFCYQCNKTLEKLNKGLEKFSQEAGAKSVRDNVEKKGALNNADSAKAESKGRRFFHVSMTELRWPFSKKENAELISELERHKTACLIALSTEQWIDTRDTLDSQKRAIDILDNIQNSTMKSLEITKAQEAKAEVKRVFEWPSSYDPSINYQTARDQHQEGTAEWIFDIPEYEEWITSPNTALWLYGIPGAGKTILSSVIIDRLFRTKRTGIAYYYCDYKSAISQDPLNVLGSLTKQFIRQHSGALRDAETFYRECHPEGLPPRRPSEDDMGILLRKVSRQFANVSLVIDGLDECGAAPGIDRSNLVRVLAKLHQDESCNIRTLIASRQEWDIEQALGSFAAIPIAARSADLQLYVAAEVANCAGKLRFRSTELRAEVIKKLIEGADGMFQWCKCQLDYLCILPSDTERQKALDTLPPGLPATYVRILERIDREYPPQTTTLVKRALKWLVLHNEGFGEECNLTLSALTHAISVSGQKSLKLDDIPQETDLVDWCSSLVRMNKKTAKLELSHFTVEEFLLEDPKKIPSQICRTYLVNKASDFKYLAETCLEYLSLQDFQESRVILEQRTFSEFQAKYPFYCQAAVHLADYLNKIPSDPSDAPVFSRFFSQQNPQMFLFWSRFVKAHGEETSLRQHYSSSQQLNVCLMQESVRTTTRATQLLLCTYASVVLCQQQS